MAEDALTEQMAAAKVADAEPPAAPAAGGGGGGGNSKKAKRARQAAAKAAAAAAAAEVAARDEAETGELSAEFAAGPDGDTPSEGDDASKSAMLQALVNGLSPEARQAAMAAGGGAALAAAAPAAPVPDKAHKFWDTQPVPKMSADTAGADGGELETRKLEDIPTEPANLPGLLWCSLDLADAAVAGEMYNLLTENYVEDDDNMFRFDYSVDFLRWACNVPGFHPEWIVGIRNAKANKDGKHKLMACITGIPQNMSVRGSSLPMAEINFLCVHKKLRAKRLAPVLIKEVTRRINLRGVWQAVYTAGVVLPKPVASCRYWHRSLNPKKLIEVGFSRLQARMTMGRTIKLYAVAKSPQTPGLMAMTTDTVAGAHALVTGYLKRFGMAPELNLEEFAHVLLPRAGVVNSYVRVDYETGQVTDFCSFYHLPSSIIGHAKHSLLKAAYSYYNVATTITLKQLMSDLLIFAKQEEMDVFNALDVMENAGVLEDLKFGIGDGHLQYYIYNWLTPPLPSSEVGLVLL